jgi:acyl-CoA thioesterase FadM
MTLNFEVLRDDPPALSAAGYQVIVCVDRTALRPRPLPPPVVAALAPYTLTLDAARAVLGVAGP